MAYNKLDGDSDAAEAQEKAEKPGKKCVKAEAKKKEMAKKMKGSSKK